MAGKAWILGTSRRGDMNHAIEFVTGMTNLHPGMKALCGRFADPFDDGKSGKVVFFDLSSPYSCAGCVGAIGREAKNYEELEAISKGFAAQAKANEREFTDGAGRKVRVSIHLDAIKLEKLYRVLADRARRSNGQASMGGGAVNVVIISDERGTLTVTGAQDGEVKSGMHVIGSDGRDLGPCGEKP